MVEQPKFKGLWMCPDFDKPINDRPPFKFKCTGMHLTEKGAREFTGAMALAIAQTN